MRHVQEATASRERSAGMRAGSYGGVRHDEPRFAASVGTVSRFCDGSSQIPPAPARRMRGAESSEGGLFKAARTQDQEG